MKLFCTRITFLRIFGGGFQQALKLAETSTYGNFRHGALLINGGSIISMGINQEKYCSAGSKFRNKNKGVATYHAELSALVNLKPEAIKGSIMYVARSAKGSKEERISKPCPMCHQYMKNAGVKAVYYTLSDTHIGTYKF